MRFLTLTLAAVVMCPLFASSAMAQRQLEAAEPAEAGDRDAWYQSSYEQPTPLMIIQAKAQMRAMARIRRIEANRAYGMSNARPTATPTPYSGMYSPAWQMPGGRPFAWHTTQRTQFILWR